MPAAKKKSTKKTATKNNSTVKKAVAKKVSSKKDDAKKPVTKKTAKKKVAVETSKRSSVTKNTRSKKIAGTKKILKSSSSQSNEAKIEAQIAGAIAPKKRRLSPKAQEKLNERIRVLIRLSKEQGFLTYKDINKALPESINSPDEIENVISILQNLEVEILDESEVEAFMARQEETEEKEVRTSQNDILDDPVRMYLKQMGQVPLLTREEEVAISKRIEKAELRAQDALFSTTLTLEFQNNIIQKLLNREERFDRVVLDKKIDSRETYFNSLPKLLEQAHKLGERIYAANLNLQPLVMKLIVSADAHV